MIGLSVTLCSTSYSEIGFFCKLIEFVIEDCVATQVF
jgi:hypothetical protein